MSLKKIVTHNGKFHCDDVVACTLLKLVPKFKNYQLIRTRDTSIIKDATVVVDVGNVYDFSNLRFDHHQPTFNLTMKDLNQSYNYNIKLSSAGLVYYHFGKEILMNFLNKITPKELFEYKLNIIFKKIYENFIQEIDAIDNGIEICENPKYLIRTSISNKISSMNLEWNTNYTEEDEYNRFIESCDYIKNEFFQLMKKYDCTWWPARDIVYKTVENRFETCNFGKIIEFKEEKCPPWKEFLFNIEKELQIEGKIKICIFKEKNNFRIQSVPQSIDSFSLRCPLPKKYRGLREEEILKLHNKKDIIFVHNNGFIGGTKTREAALELAKQSLEENNLI